ncbi:MAG: glutamate formimidoyltransferase [Rikenellaceae bacterium]
MTRRLIECVTNFSEGINIDIINAIADAIRSVEGVELLNIDPGKAANRTVYTFVGEPELVVESAFRAVKKAQELIDMRLHRGEHPRIGATDVMPLIPIEGVTMEETVVYARGLAKRVGEELKIPVYCYENAAFDEKRRNLASCRKGEYEGIKEKLADPLWKPDFGSFEYNDVVAQSGISVIGAREFLLAVNFNLNTDSEHIAKEIALDVREKGRIIRDSEGQKIVDTAGCIIVKKGLISGLKAIGWYIKEYGKAQVSTNITNMHTAPLNVVFDEVSRKAGQYGVKVTGTEIIGLVPLRALLDCGNNYLEAENSKVDLNESEIIEYVIVKLGLSELCEFKPEEKIIEYLLMK